jgi:hypothetical protein
MLRQTIKQIYNPILAIQQKRQMRMCDKKLKLVLDEMLQADIDLLRQVNYVEKLIQRVGLVRDPRDIYGDDNRFMNPIARGLWQIPRQLAEFAVFLSQHRIRSFIEVGTFTGYTFTFLMGYLDRFNPGLTGITLDIYDCKPVKLLGSDRFKAQFAIGTSLDFADCAFDLCLIDGDHSLAAVNADFKHIGCHANICAFHDINDKIVEFYPGNDGGVPQFWKQFKTQSPDREFQEFVYHTHGARVMGIGVAVRRVSYQDRASGIKLEPPYV